MATRSLICLKKEDCYEIVYCHWDGYPVHNGLILERHYKNPNKIQELIDLGDMSSLGKEIGEKHDFENPTIGWTVFYGRDRGEENINARIVFSFEDLKEIANNCAAEFVYIFENGKWKCYDSDWNEVEIPY